MSYVLVVNAELEGYEVAVTGEINSDRPVFVKQHAALCARHKYQSMPFHGTRT